MEYLALYRKWRPKTFDDIVGQEHIVTTLKNQIINRRIAHAYLLCGSRGTGKTTVAKIIARAVNCLDPRDGSPCYECTACRAGSGDSVLDIVEIDAASNNGVDEIRDLRERAKYPPQAGQYKVYIIDEVHMLSTGAFNALLKTLEEPPPHVLFILATTEPHRLPATILSRCQRYDFRRIPARQIAGRLRQVLNSNGIAYQEAAVMRIARAAEGALRDALSTLDICMSSRGDEITDELVCMVLGTADSSLFKEFTQSLIDGDSKAALSGIDSAIRGGLEPAAFARDAAKFIRSVLMAAACGPDELDELLETSPEEASDIYAMSQTASIERLMRALDLFIQSQTDMKWATAPRLALELAAIRSCRPEEELELLALSDRMAAAERRIEGIETAPPAMHAAGGNIPKTDMDAIPGGVAKRPDAGDGHGDAASRSDAKSAGGNAAKKTAKPADGATVWQAALDKLKKENVRIYGAVRKLKFKLLKDDIAHIEYSKDDEIYVDLLSKPENRSAVEAAFTDARGSGTKIQLAPEKKAREGVNERNAQDNLSRINKLFPRDLIEMRDID